MAPGVVEDHVSFAHDPPHQVGIFLCPLTGDTETRDNPVIGEGVEDELGVAALRPGVEGQGDLSPTARAPLHHHARLGTATGWSVPNSPSTGVPAFSTCRKRPFFSPTKAGSSMNPIVTAY